MKTKVLIVDDHPVTRSGIRYILELNGQFNIIGEAKDGVDAIKKVSDKKPDIVIMDVSMPEISGIEATKQITKTQPDIKVIALSIHSGQKFVKEMLQAGAAGYILKDEAPEELITAIDKIIKGDIYLSSGVTRVALSKEETEPVEIGPEILKTKLLRPPDLPSYLVRNRIIDLLERNVTNPFSLISAGAEYGKSITVSQWLGHTARIYAWISLDEEHNNLQIFLSYMVAAIEQVIPGSLNQTAKAIAGEELPEFGKLSYIVFNDLCEIEKELILVLDNYHKIHEVKIHQFIDQWLSFPPPSLHLSIISRLDPPIQLNSLRLTGRITEIRMDSLSFTKREIEEFFKLNLNIDLSNKVVDILYRKTEGWIIPLRLASKAMEKADNLQKVMESFEGGLEAISVHLVSEVLSRQPENIQNALLVSSVLNRFCSDILDEVYLFDKDLSGKQLIDFMVAEDMFVINLDTENRWFRYNHLIQDLLQEQLFDKHRREEINRYYSKASFWCEKNGFLEEAMDYAVAIFDYGRAKEVILKHRLDLLVNSEFSQLEKLLQKIPVSVIELDPELILVECYIQWKHYNFTRLGELEEKMNLLITNLEEDSYVFGEFNFFISINSLFLKEDLALAIKYLDMALALVPESVTGIRGLLEFHQMIYYQLDGKFEEISQKFYNLIRKNIEPNRLNYLIQGFIVASMNQANMNEAEKNFLSAISLARKSKIKETIGSALYLSGSIMIRKGFMKQAIDYFKDVMDIRNFMQFRAIVDIYTGLSISYNLMNDNTKAVEIINSLERHIIGLGDYFKNFLWSTRIRHHLINKDYKMVRKLLPDYNPGVFDPILRLDVPEITHARALVTLGMRENLEKAEKELADLETRTAGLQNKIHLLEVKILQSILFDKLGRSDDAIKALLSSFDISENEEIILFYLELGELFISLINKMPNDIRNTSFVTGIIKKINVYTGQQTRSTPDKTKNVLTNREMEVLKYIADGLRNQEIADRLFNTEDTIKKHIYNMFQKMGVKNRLSLVSKAIEHGILEDKE